jgi:thiol-disulfide isomerase/thioredoxin
MKTPLIVISVVILAVVGWLLISNTGQHQNMNSSSNTNTQIESSIRADKAPDFHLQDYNGKTVKLADFAGRPLIINSWAAWCPFCRKELADFAIAQKEFGDDVVIIAIDRAESQETAKKYTDELGVTNDLTFLLDPSDSFYQSIGGFSMPETIFVDKNGNIVERKRGPMEINEIRQKIQKLLSA